MLYAELKKAKVVARTLAPSRIFVDKECCQMTLTDVTALIYKAEPVYYFPPAIMPYDYRDLKVNWLTRVDSSEYDLWSIGMMALEVIAGSKLVLPLRSYEAV